LVQFIDVLTGQIGKRAGHHLESCTAEVQAVTVENYIDSGSNLVLVDTPGFDDTNKADTEILTMISDWLEKT
jgi:predicted GTPase